MTSKLDRPRFLLLPHDDQVRSYVHIRHHLGESSRLASVNPVVAYLDLPRLLMVERVKAQLSQLQPTTADRPYRPEPVTDWGRDVQHAVVKEHGFSFHDHIGDGPRGGYMVSVDPDTEHTIPLRDLHPDHIADYRDMHQDALRDPNSFLGAWVHRGKVYLDISRHVDSKDEALELARKHNQLGIYDLGSGQTIMTNQSGERPGQEPKAASRG